MTFTARIISLILAIPLASKVFTRLVWALRRMTNGTWGEWVLVVQDPLGHVLAISDSAGPQRLLRERVDADQPVLGQLLGYIADKFPDLDILDPEIVAVERRMTDGAVFVFGARASTEGAATIAQPKLSWITGDLVAAKLSDEDRRAIDLTIK